MSLFSTPQTHAENAPETWQTVKVADRAWEVQTKDGTTLTRMTRKVDADMVRTCPESFMRMAYDKEGRWYAGAQIPGWKSWAECKAERERTAARAARAADVSPDAAAVLIAQLNELIFDWDGKYVELRTENLPTQDECAEVYDTCANQLRKIRDGLMARSFPRRPAA
jgi:hypothetical protein